MCVRVCRRVRRETGQFEGTGEPGAARRLHELPLPGQSAQSPAGASPPPRVGTLSLPPAAPGHKTAASLEVLMHMITTTMIFMILGASVVMVRSSSAPRGRTVRFSGILRVEMVSNVPHFFGSGTTFARQTYQ